MGRAHAPAAPGRYLPAGARYRQLYGTYLHGPVLLLEGGYNPTTLPYLVAAILDALGDLDLAIFDPYARHVPVSDEALRRLQAVADTLRPWWTLS